MKETEQLRALALAVRRGRRRLRLQHALEWATTAIVPASAAAAVLLYLWRMEHLTGRSAAMAALALPVLVLAAGIAGACRRLSDRAIAFQIDQASGLDDRLGTAHDFAERLAGRTDDLHPDTVEMMRLAVADGLRMVPRADVRAATRFRAPRDTRAAVTFVALAGSLALLSFGPEDPPPSWRLRLVPIAVAATRPEVPVRPPEDQALDPEDVEFTRDLVKELARKAHETGDPNLQQMAQKLDKLLAKAESGELSKEQLLAEMEELEKAHMAGSKRDLDAGMEDLKKLGKELKKEKATEKLGKALEQGKLDEAREELEKLADKVAKKELSPKQQEKIAEALERALAKKEREEKQEAEAEQAKVDKKKDEVRKLERKVAEASPKEQEQLKRKLERQKRELEKLEREKKDKDAQAQGKKRQLERLSRKAKETAEDLKNQDQKAADDLQKLAEEMSKYEDEYRKLDGQKTAKSKVQEIKEAMRRARLRRQQGGQARLQRLKDFQRRAGGQQGNPQAWKPGQRSLNKGQKGQGQGQGQGQQGQAQNGQPGQGQPGQGQGQGGQGQDGQESDSYGQGHNPEVLGGDPTARLGTAQDEQVSGVHGKGPSRRDTILASAKKGFATQAYKKVYADYQKVIEEVIRQEKIPQGYRHHVKRYFQRIKPHSMD